MPSVQTHRRQHLRVRVAQASLGLAQLAPRRVRSSFSNLFALSLSELVSSADAVLPTASQMATAMEDFYTNNLNTLSTDLAGVTILSFQIQRAPSVDSLGNPTTIYIGPLLFSSAVRLRADVFSFL